MTAGLIASDVAYGTHARQHLDVYAPSSASKLPVIMFWYGGSWRGGSKERYHTIGRALAELGYVVVIADYRIYPAVKFPVFVEDAALAVAWAQDNIGKYGGDAHNMVLMGHSAGAHIASVLAFDDHYLKNAGVALDSIKAFVGLSGPYDFYPRPDLRPIFDLTDPAQPWRPINLVQQPKIPSLLIHGRLDLLVRPGNSTRMAHKLQAARAQVSLKRYPFSEHMGTLFGLVWPASLVNPTRRDVKRFLADTLKK